MARKPCRPCFTGKLWFSHVRWNWPKYCINFTNSWIIFWYIYIYHAVLYIMHFVWIWLLACAVKFVTRGGYRTIRRHSFIRNNAVYSGAPHCGWACMQMDPYCAVAPRLPPPGWTQWQIYYSNSSGRVIHIYQLVPDHLSLRAFSRLTYVDWVDLELDISC